MFPPTPTLSSSFANVALAEFNALIISSFVASSLAYFIFSYIVVSNKTGS